jgi:hypothetical protein
MAARLNTEGNSGLKDGPVIRMDEKRSARFNRTLLQLDDAVQSLATAADKSPDPIVVPGEMDPRATVAAFTALMDQRMSLLQSMVNAEEHLNDDQRESADD